MKKDNLVCDSEKVKPYLTKTDKKDLSTQDTTSEDCHTDTLQEDSLVS